MMDRREFFKQAFALGIVATVPHSIFALDSTEQIDETIQEREIDFGNYDAVLMRDERIIAKSHRVNIHMEWDVIDVSTAGSAWKEYIPGKLSFDIRMMDIQYDDMMDLKALHLILASGNKLTAYIRHRIGKETYVSDCYLGEMMVTAGKDEPNLVDLNLHGSGAMIVLK